MKHLGQDTSLWLTFLAGMFLLIVLGGRAEALILHVANNGVDSPACGSEADPCRSINRALVRAATGDRIIVGPGRYGDLNGNGIFGESGEEIAQIGFGCRCMIHLNKRVTLVSRDGASTTVLDGGGIASIAVRISANGVAFGQPGHGFLITGAQGNGLSATGTNVRIAGNIASGNGFNGFFVDGNGSQVSNNLAVNNGNFGFSTGGSRQVWRQNIATGNVHGFGVIGNEHVLRENRSIGNLVDGLVVFDGTGQIQLLSNAVIGNGDAGIRLGLQTTATIRRNDIYGNNGCGLVNESQGSIGAQNNFWGAVTGPGPVPANDVCDFGPSNTVFTPFATKEFANVVQGVP